MFGFRQNDKNNKQKTVDKKMEQINGPLETRKVSYSLKDNVDTMKALFLDVEILRTRTVENNYHNSARFGIFYCDGVVNSSLINDNIIKPLMLSSEVKLGDGLIDTIIEKVVQVNDAAKTDNFKEIVKAVTYGDTILFAEGANQAVILSTKEFALRSIAEPDNEKVLSGPREGFSESLMQNLSLVRRRARTNDLKMKFLDLGRRTQTSICVCYFDSLINKDILDQLMKKLKEIDIDAVLDTNYLTELIRGARYSPFRITGYTERPDIVVGKLLEGRIAVFVDGTPNVITVPYLFIENFQSNEDYYLSFYFTSFSRILRIFGFFLTIVIPGLYIAIVAYHIEMLPTPLLINISAERQSVPLPAAVEAFVMLITFDVLRETGVRMPSNTGQALSIVGALVIGQAAVTAKLVAAPMIIVIAVTGITNLLIPKLNAPVIYIRFALLLLASTLGLFGLTMGLCTLMIHLLNLESLGIPQLSLPGSFKFQAIKDTAFRAPWWTMRLRPDRLNKNQVRMKQKDEKGND